MVSLTSEYIHKVWGTLKKEIVGSLTEEEYWDLRNNLVTGPEKYTKPIRIYCDVDGVVMPFINDQEDLDRLDGDATIQITTWQGFGSDTINITESRFLYHKAVAAKLSEWSHRDDVDFIWLTAWRFNAPYSLDKLLNIKSSGFMEWDEKRSDYNQAFKRFAIEEEQKVSPSKFIWLDDIANKTRYYENGCPDEELAVPVFTHGSYNYEYDKHFVAELDKKGQQINEQEVTMTFIPKNVRIDPKQYLSLTTDSYVGLSEKEISQVDAWLSAESA